MRELVRLVVSALLVLAVPIVGWAQETDGDVDALRSAMESAYVDVQAGHAAVNAAGFEESIRSSTVAAWLEQFATAAQDTDLRERVDAAIADTRSAGQPLRGIALRVVLKTLDGRRGQGKRESDGSGADQFLEAVSSLFHAGVPPDEVWDNHFLGEPVVVAWRAAHGGGDDPSATQPAAETPLISLPKLRVDVGPWEGWLNDLTDRQNRRTKASVKVLHVDAHEVTGAQYLAFLAAQPPEKRAGLLPVGWKVDDAGTPLVPEGRGSHPVTGVSFVQAQAYAAAAGKRIPTEDEWERIAAAGDEKRLFPWGPTVAGRSWAHATPDGGTAAVDAHPEDVTPEGVLGLAGNVAELVATLADRKNVGRGKLAKDARVATRGGSFRSRPGECQTRFRWVVDAREGQPHVGFRCVMDDAEFKRLNTPR